MYVLTAFAKQGQFHLAVHRAAQHLRPHVIDLTFTLGNDWSGEPAVFFMVILSNAQAVETSF